MREIIKITSEEQWLQLRKSDITSTMSPALFNLSPYGTVFELYHAKKSGVHVPFDENDRTQKGKRMEAYAAQEVALRMGWEVWPLDIYVRDPELKMGTSFDFGYKKPDGKKGILEIKAVDHFQFKQKWQTKSETDEESGEEIPPEAPAHIEIQAQHQLEAKNDPEFEEITIAPFISIYDFHIFTRARDREFGNNIRTGIKKFWADVANGNEPNPNFYRDGKVIDQLYKDAGGDPIDMTGDSTFEGLAARYERLAAEEKSAKEARQATKYEIHRILENEGGAFTDKYKVLTTWTKDSPAKLITQEMVGTIIPGRKGYRQCRITSLTKKGML